MSKLILTVCKGNIHRSVIAAACIQEMIVRRGLAARYEVMSRGLQGTMKTKPSEHRNLRDYPMEWPLTKPVLEELGIEIATDQQSTPITQDVAERASLILAMDSLVLSELPNSLIKQFPTLGKKLRLFTQIAGRSDDVPDTGGVSDPVAHRFAVCVIHSTVLNHFDDLLTLIDNP